MRVELACSAAERFRSVSTLYFRDAAAALLVYDITDASSFESLPHWLATLRNSSSNHVILAVAGNKADRPASARRVSTEVRMLTKLPSNASSDHSVSITVRLKSFLWSCVVS